MANDAYQLQGLNGWDVVASGQTFTGRSRGFQITTAGDYDADTVSPKNVTVSVVGTGTVGLFIGGVITSLAISASGEALVYPLDDNYTIA